MIVDQLFPEAVGEVSRIFVKFAILMKRVIITGLLAGAGMLSVAAGAPHAPSCCVPPESAALLEELYTLHPTDVRANEARLKRADIDFFAHRWADALNLYRQADIRGLSRPDRSLYSYRMALCLIRTGHYADAREWLDDVRGRAYADVRNFYDAYLDYIDGDLDRAYDGFARVTPGIEGLDATCYMAQIDYSRGRYTQVLDRTAPMLRGDVNPELAPEMYRIAGMSNFKLDNYEAARSDLQKYLELNDEAGGTADNEALYALGCMAYDDGDYEEAERCFGPVTEGRPALAQSAWLYIGQCRLMNSDTRGATLAFEKAASVETDPSVARTAMYDYIAALTRGAGVPFAKSAGMLETWLRRWPDSPYAANAEQYLATAYFNDHDYLKAIAVADGARRAGKALLAVKQKALYEQGVKVAANGDAAGSATWFRRAAAMNNVDPALAAQALLWLGDAQYASGNFKDAAKSYSRFLSDAPQGPNRALGLYNLAYAQYRSGLYSQAAANFLKASQTRPALAKPLVDDATIRRADCLYYTGDYHAAEALYNSALGNRAADSDYAAYRQAMMTGLTGSQRDKINALGAFVEKYPDSRWVAQALLEKALTHEDLGETAQAAEARRRRLAITPDVDVDELINAARTNDIAGTAPEEQLRILERIRRNGSLQADELADIDLYEANALARLGRDVEADEIYGRLAANPSSLPGATAAVTLAERQLKAGQAKAAFDGLSAFTDAGTPHSYWLARGFIALADACSALGRPELAREYIISLRDNYPGNEPDILSAIKSRLKK